MIPIKTDTSWRGASKCQNCGLRHLGLFADLDQTELQQVHAPIDDLFFRSGQRVYTEGSRAPGVLMLRSGLLKLGRVTADGRQRVMRIVRPGDMAGLEALATQRYDSDAEALTDIEACRIPLEVVQRLSEQTPRLYPRLMLKWQQALKQADDWLADVNFGTARQRVRGFVMKMRDVRDPSLTTLFSREDMGAMMDLKHETVSREVSLLVKTGALEPLDKSGRLYRVRDPLLHLA